MGFFSNLFKSAPAVDYKELIKGGAILLDVRTAQEFAAGHLKGAINIPVNSLKHKLSSLKKGKPVIVYCASGSRSMLAKSILEQNGFKDIYNGGGISRLTKRLEA